MATLGLLRCHNTPLRREVSLTSFRINGSCYNIRSTQRTLPVLQMLRIAGDGKAGPRFRTTGCAPPLAFAFDIVNFIASCLTRGNFPTHALDGQDGVLIRGPHALPAGKRALAMLESHNPFGVKIPYILVGSLIYGGQLLAMKLSASPIAYQRRGHWRRREMSQALYFARGSDQAHAHTVLKSIVNKYATEPVLVLGGARDNVRKVAESYGFLKPYIPWDVHAWNPSVWPFHKLSDAERLCTKPIDFSETPIKAIFVFHDPRNWSLDIQIICDVLLSGGIIGGPYTKEQVPIELVFCNPDLLWRSEFERPRLGQGAFREAFQAVYKALTGATYPYIQYGKPSAATYDFAEQVLRDRVREIHGGKVEKMPNVYMVGDNPESDIAGANAAEWSSVLVRTGVYDPATGPPKHRATHEAEDVEAAVKWAIERELSRRQR